MNMGVCLGVCEIIEHDNLANNQSIMILYSILQGHSKLVPMLSFNAPLRAGRFFCFQPTFYLIKTLLDLLSE